MLLDNPTNAAWQVPACGLLRAASPRFVQRFFDRYEAEGPGTVDQETATELSLVREGGWEGRTLFEALIMYITSLANDWNGDTHRAMRKGFSVTISLGKSMRAEMYEVLDYPSGYPEDGSVPLCRTPFVGPDSEINPPGVTPIQRQAVIQLEHIEMLAQLYAGTLNYYKLFADPTPSETVSASTTADTETENADSLPQEPTPSDCQPSAPATSDDDAGTRANGLHSRGSKMGVRVSSSGKRVRAEPSTRTRRRFHDLAPHHHAPA